MSFSQSLNSIDKGKLLLEFTQDHSYELFDSYIEINPSSKELLVLKEVLKKLTYSNWFEGKRILDYSESNGYISFWSAFKAAGNITTIISDNDKNNRIQSVINDLNLDDITLLKEFDANNNYDLVIAEYNSENIQQLIESTNNILIVYSSNEFNIDQDYIEVIDHGIEESNLIVKIIYLNPELKVEVNNNRNDIPLQDIFIEFNEKEIEYFILKNWEIVTHSQDPYQDLSIDIYMDDESIELFEQRLNNVLKVNVNGKVVYQFPIGQLNNKDVFLNIKIINAENERVPEKILELFKKSLIRDNSIVRINNHAFTQYLIFIQLYNIGAIELNYLRMINESFRKSNLSKRLDNFIDVYIYAKDNDLLVSNYNNELGQNSLSYLDDPKNVIESDSFVIEDIPFIRRVYLRGEEKIIQVPKPIGEREFKLVSKLLSKDQVYDYKEKDFESYYTLKSSIAVSDPYEFYTRLLNDDNQDPAPDNFKDLIFFDDSDQKTFVFTGDKEIATVMIKLCEKLGVRFDFETDLINYQVADLYKSKVRLKNNLGWWGIYFDDYKKNIKEIDLLDNYLIITNEKLDLSSNYLFIEKEELLNNAENILLELLRLIDLEIPKDNIKDYISVIHQNFKAIPKKIEDAALKVNQLIEERDFENALKEVDYLIDNSGRLSEGQKILYVKALCLAELGRIDEALNYINQEIILNPDNEEAYELKDKLEKDVYQFNYKDVSQNNSTLVIVIGKLTDNEMEMISDADHLIQLSEFTTESINKIILENNYNNVVIIDNAVPADASLLNLVSDKLNKRNVLLGAKILYKNMVFHAGYVWGPIDVNLKMPYLIYLSSNPNSPQVNKERNFQFVGAGFIAFRKEAFENVEGFDHELNGEFSIFDLCLKMLSSGIEVCYDPELVLETKRSLTFLNELSNKVIENKESIEFKNLQKLIDKWKDFIVTDDGDYYEEDMMWGLSSEEHKFTTFHSKIKDIFQILKNLPEDHFQEIAQEVSKFFFGRTGIDFTGSPELLMNISYQQLLEAEEFLKNKTNEIYKENIALDNKFFDEDEEDEPLNKSTSESNVRFSNQKAKGKLPAELPSPLKINVGCGLDVKDDYLNIDLYSDDPRVIGMDVRDLKFEDNTVDEILASDILEHFSHNQVDQILSEWSRVLKPGGILFIRCPNLKLQMQAYMRGDWDADIASYMIFGGQTNPGDYHFIAFDEDSIKSHLDKAGFEVTDYKELDYPQNRMKINLNMEVTAKKIISDNYGEKEINEIRSMFDENKKDIKKHDEIKPITTKLISRKENQPQMNIVWEGSQFIYHSLALINREICYNIIKSEAAELSIIPYEKDTFKPEGIKKYEMLFEKDVRNKDAVSSDIAELPYVWIRHQWPPKDEPPIGAKWIIMQPWEFSSFRKDFVKIFNQAEEIWTPSNYSRNAFVNSGINPNKVQVIPNGIDPELFKPYGNKYPLKTKKKLKLLYLGGTIPRKGIDVLLEAYFKAFTSHDDVCLIIKDIGATSFYSGQNASQQIKKFIEDKKSAEIEYIDNDLTEVELASLYRACDVYVSPYRGEGFSLPTLEAMASGLPVVVTAGGSTDDFVGDLDGWKIPSSDKVIGKEIGGFETVNEASILEPDTEALTNTLKDIYTNPGRNFTSGLLASFHARKNWNWKRTTIKIFSRLDSLYGTKMASKAFKNIEDISDNYLKLGEAEEAFINGQFNTALDIYSSIEDSKDIPKDYIVFAKIMCLIELDDLTEAMSEMENVDKEYENHPDAIYLKSQIALKNSDTTSALEKLGLLLNDWQDIKWDSKLGISLDSIMCEIAKIMFDLGDLEGSLQLYQNAITINKLNAFAYYGAGMCFKTNEQEKEANEFFDIALKLDPNILEDV